MVLCYHLVVSNSPGKQSALAASDLAADDDIGAGGGWGDDADDLVLDEGVLLFELIPITIDTPSPLFLTSLFNISIVL